MKTNYSQVLRQLQLAYLQVTMKDQSDDEVCLYCWKSGCGCSNNTVKTDSFINLTTAGEFKYA